MVLECFLEKEGSLVKSWRRRLFVLTTKRLRYHIQHSYEPQKGEILLSDILDVTADLSGDTSALPAPEAKAGLFRRSQSMSTTTVAVITVSCTGRQLRLRGPSQDIEKWFVELKAVLSRMKAAATSADPEVGRVLSQKVCAAGGCLRCLGRCLAGGVAHLAAPTVLVVYHRHVLAQRHVVYICFDGVVRVGGTCRTDVPSSYAPQVRYVCDG